MSNLFLSPNKSSISAIAVVPRDEKPRKYPFSAGSGVRAVLQENQDGSPEPDEFDKLLAAHETKSSSSPNFVSENALTDSSSGFNLPGFLTHNESDRRQEQNGRITPPMDVLEAIGDEDDDSELFEFQNSVLKWTFREGNHIGARFQEGEYDLDVQDETVDSISDGSVDKISYKQWWDNRVMPFDKSAMNREERDDVESDIFSMADPLVRFFSSILEGGLVETFQHVFRIVHTNQQEFLRRQSYNAVDSTHLYIKKEPSLLVQLASTFGQIENFLQNAFTTLSQKFLGMADSAFTFCYDKILEHCTQQDGVDIITDELKFYLHKLSKQCIMDGGRNQAVAAFILADHWKLKGKDIAAFRLYVQVFLISRNKSWALTADAKLSDHAATALFYYYIQWGQSQEIALVAENYYKEAQSMAEHVRKNDMRATAMCCRVESDYFSDQLDLLVSRKGLAGIKQTLQKLNELTAELKAYFNWADSLLLLKEKKFQAALSLLKRSVSTFEKLDNPSTLQKIYRETGLIYELQGHTHAAFGYFRSAWITKRRSPILPSIEEDGLPLSELITIGPDHSSVGFVPYVKKIYGNVADTQRRRRALDVCLLYLEMSRPIEREIDSEGYGNVNMDGPLVCMDHDIHMPTVYKAALPSACF